MGFFDGLFSSNDYGYGGYTGNAGNAFDSASGDYGTIGSYGQQQLQAWQPDNASYRKSMLDYANQLGQDPATAQNKAAALAPLSADAATIYAQARSRLQADTAARGIDTAGDQGKQSSETAGGIGSLDLGYADALARNSANYWNAYQSPDAVAARMGRRSQVLGQLANGEASSGINALGDAAGGYAGLGQDWTRLADLAEQRQQSDQSGWDQIFGGIGEGIGGGLGGGWFSHGKGK